MITVNDTIALEEDELVESFLRASGAGGQNVQKVSTAVQLRFDVRNSSSLPEEVRTRLVALAGRRITRDGVLVIVAQRHRTQLRNREDARERLLALIRQAAEPPAPKRRPTRPTAASERRRVASKLHRAATKRQRSRPADE